MPKETMTWDGAGDQKLLLGILSSHDIKLDFASIAISVGPPCTAMAVQKRIQKLKCFFKNQKEEGSDSHGSNAPKIKSAAQVKGSNVSKSGSKKRTTTIDETSHDDHSHSSGAATGKKRQASEMQKSVDPDVASKRVKLEDVDSEDGQSIVEFDPASDQLIAECQAYQVAI